MSPATVEPRRTRRGGSARGARLARRQSPPSSAAVAGALEGGKFKPLSEHEIQRIHDTALDLLEQVGVANPIPDTRERALAAGCRVDDSGRLCFPRAFVEDVIAGAAREYVLFGREARHDLQIGGARVYFSTCGEAIWVLDPGAGEYRPSSLLDVYDFARLVDVLDHIQMFAQTVIASELSEDVMLHDTNVAYALMSGTGKHAAIALMDATSVDAVFEMAQIFAGGEKAFRKRPFLSVGQCPIVSPLSFGAENSLAITKAIHYGSPIEFAVVPQSGATGPAALAGNLVLSTAEALAGLVLVNLVKKGHPTSVGNWPFVSDLRTGAFSGGGGEEAIMSAAAAQIVNFYDLPSHTAAGMSDSKLPDAQAGYEKALTNTLVGAAGCNLVYESAGMLASLMCCSYEAMVIDNDMLGAIRRTLRGIEVTDETLSFEVIKKVVLGPGHFLGEAQTLALMETEYLYPRVADRATYDEWKAKGGGDARETAAKIAREILADHYPSYNSREADERVRNRFRIELPPDAMSSASNRWSA